MTESLTKERLVHFYDGRDYAPCDTEIIETTIYSREWAGVNCLCCLLTHINALTAENQRLETRIELGRKLEDLVCRKRKRQAKELNAKDAAIIKLKSENQRLREALENDDGDCYDY